MIDLFADIGNLSPLLLPPTASNRKATNWIITSQLISLFMTKIHAMIEIKLNSIIVVAFFPSCQTKLNSMYVMKLLTLFVVDWNGIIGIYGMRERNVVLVVLRCDFTVPWNDSLILLDFYFALCFNDNKQKNLIKVYHGKAKEFAKLNSFFTRFVSLQQNKYFLRDTIFRVHNDTVSKHYRKK